MISTKIPESWVIPTELRNRFGKNGVGKQRAMEAEGHLLLILHKVPKEDARKREAIIFWRNPQGEWIDNHKSKGLYKLRKHIDEYVVKEVGLNQRYDKASKPEDYFDLLEELTPLVRAAANMAKALQQAREFVKDDTDIIDMRDSSQEVSRELEILYTDARNGLDYTVAKRAEEQAKYSMATSKSTDKLNLLVAIFLPVTAMSGIFGMNFKTGLENASTVMFWIVTISSFILGFGVKSWILNEEKDEN